MANKGTPWERKLCKTLSLWWTNGECDAVMWRTACSGGRATVRARQGKTTAGHYGDIQATDPVAEPLFRRITIEAKKGYNQFDLLKLLDGTQGRGKHLLEQWIVQSRGSSNDAGVKWFWIILRRDRYKPVIFIDRDQYKYLRTKHMPPSQPVTLCRMKPESVACMPLEEFLSWTDPSAFGRDSA